MAHPTQHDRRINRPWSRTILRLRRKCAAGSTAPWRASPFVPPCMIHSLLAALAILASLAAVQAQSLPPLPFEDIGACPFEGCVYREWVARSAVEIRSERQTAAPVLFQV